MPVPVGEAGQGTDESCSQPEDKTEKTNNTEPHILLLQTTITQVTRELILA